MSNSNINTSSDPSFRPSSAFSSSSPPLSNASTQKTEQADFQTIDSTDFLDSGKIVIQQFISAQRYGKKDYSTDPNHPILEVPLTEGELSVQPFPSHWQMAVNKYFKEMVKELALKKMKEETAAGSKESETNPELTNQGVTARVNHILQAIVDKNTSTLKDEDLEIATSATKKTQQAWSLPSSWALGTQEVTAWTPTKIDVVPPVNLESSAHKILGKNLSTLLQSLERSSKKVVAEIPEEDPKNEEVKSALRVIADAIRGLKRVLEKLQLEEGEQSSKFSELKYDQLIEQQAELKKIQKEQAHAARLRKKANKMNKIMKIVAPTIASVIVLVGVIALPFSAGTSSAVIVLGATIASSGMLAYTVADSQENLTARMIEAYNQAMVNAFPNGGWQKQLVEAVIIVAIIAVLAAVVFCTGGSAAAEAATQAGTVATQVAIEATKQLAIQAIIMFVMASNTIPKLAKSLAITCGVDRDDQDTLMIIEITVMAVTMLATIWLASQGPAVDKAATGAKTMTQSAKDTLNGIKDSFLKIIDSVQSTVKKSGDITMEAILKSLKEALLNLASVFDPRSFVDAGKGLKESLSMGHMASDETRDWARFSVQLQNLLRTANLGLEAHNSFSLMVIGFDLAKSLRNLAEIQKAEEVIKLLIQMLEQMVDGFQTDLKSQGEWYTSLNNALDSIIQANNQTSTRAVQQFTA